MTTAADLILRAQQRADRVNAGTITPAEWLGYVSVEAGRLFALLVSTWDDWNVKKHTFTLKGGDGVGNNILQLGPGTSVPEFGILRHLSANVNPVSASSSFAPVLRADSPFHFDELSAPLVGAYYSAFIRVYYWLRGRDLEIRPAASAGLSYVMYYIPTFKPFVNTNESMNPMWLSVNGADEYIVLGAAAKALVKEESLDTANLVLQQQESLRQQILSQFAQRDDNQPGRIVDVKRASRLVGAGWGRW